jgi:hypothetical protein
LPPVVGAETFICKSTILPGINKVTGLTENIGVAGRTGICADFPILIWSLPNFIPVSFSSMLFFLFHFLAIYMMLLL